MKWIVVAGWVFLSGAAMASAVQKSALRVVPQVDFGRYAGRWYEIARLPNRFQEKCAGQVTATYSQEPNGQIRVVNRCRQSNGEHIEAEGVAKLAGRNQPNSKLKVRFAPGFLSFLPMVWGDYQIIALASDYSHALVGSPDRKYLWILSRTPQLDEATYNRLVEEARSQGFDVMQLMKTRQSVS
jgi:apolipoprotein D and lipocalin family protein